MVVKDNAFGSSAGGHHHGTPESGATTAPRVARLPTERGQTMAEYGILIAVIALIVVVAAVALGGSLSGLFHATASKV
jgi:Flp pilus assembly pilin Flp